MNDKGITQNNRAPGEIYFQHVFNVFSTKVFIRFTKRV